MNGNISFTLARLAEQLGARLVGDPDLLISGLATLQEAEQEQLAFLANSQYRKFLADSRAGAVLLTETDAEGFSGNALIVVDPYLSYARLSHQFDPKPRASIGIHPSAVVAEDAIKILESEESLKKFKDGAKNRAEEFNVDLILPKYLALYNKVLDEQK